MDCHKKETIAGDAGGIMGRSRLTHGSRPAPAGVAREAVVASRDEMGLMESRSVYVYGDRAFTAAAAAAHHPVLRRRLARSVAFYGPTMPRHVYRVTGEGVDQLAVDPVDVYHIVRRFPQARVKVLRVEGPSPAQPHM